jgi:hypothetical protein
MGSRGRRSAAADAGIPRVDGRPERLRPPASLSEKEAARFDALIAACDAEHFRPSDMPLLTRFCEADVLGDLAALRLRQEGAVVDGKANAWLIVLEKSQRAIVALSLRLRLSPQSRLAPKTVGRRNNAASPYDMEL